MMGGGGGGERFSDITNCKLLYADVTTIVHVVH